MADLHLYPGQRFEGRGDYAGLALTVTSVRGTGYVGVLIERMSDAEIADARVAITRYRAALMHRAAEMVERRLAGEPRKDLREVNWFRQWLKRGLLVDVSSEQLESSR